MTFLIGHCLGYVCGNEFPRLTVQFVSFAALYAYIDFTEFVGLLYFVVQMRVSILTTTRVFA